MQRADDAAPADKPSAGKRARPAAEADEGDGADDWGDTDTGDADQENADGAVDEALEGLASQVGRTATSVRVRWHACANLYATRDAVYMAQPLVHECSEFQLALTTCSR